MINRRFSVLAKKENAPFTSADVKCTFDLLLDRAKDKLRLNFRAGWYSNIADVTPDGDFGAVAYTEKKVIESGVPTFGICLGHQMLGIAVGGKTTKMHQGHHGANHPVKDLDNGRVSITSQNHGFAVDEATLPDYLQATHRSLFDGSLQGIRRTDTPAFSFQGHPEASPGPHDIGYLFDRFIAMMKGNGNA